MVGQTVNYICGGIVVDDDMKLCMAGCYEQFLIFFKDYMDKVAQIQKEGRIKALHYLSIQPMRVGIRMNKLMFRVQVMEADFYLGEREIVEYYYPSELQQKFAEGIALLYQETREKIIRMQQYEWGEMRNQYAKQYITFVYLMFKNGMPSIMACMEKSHVKIADDFKILFGEYMGRSVLLY